MSGWRTHQNPAHNQSGQVITGTVGIPYWTMASRVACAGQFKRIDCSKPDFVPSRQRNVSPSWTLRTWQVKVTDLAGIRPLPAANAPVAVIVRTQVINAAATTLGNGTAGHAARGEHAGMVMLALSSRHQILPLRSHIPDRTVLRERGLFRACRQKLSSPSRNIRAFAVAASPQAGSPGCLENWRFCRPAVPGRNVGPPGFSHWCAAPARWRASITIAQVSRPQYSLSWRASRWRSSSVQSGQMALR